MGFERLTVTKNDHSGHSDYSYIHLRVFRADLSKKIKLYFFDPLKVDYPLNRVHGVKLKTFRGQRGMPTYF